MTWWAAQVAKNKEYDAKREIVSSSILLEDEVFVPRQQLFEMQEGVLEKKKEKMIPGYIFLLLGDKPNYSRIESLANYIKVIGPITDNEMDHIKSHENIPKELDVEGGDKIIVIKGSFAGVKGSIMSKDDAGKYHCKLVFQGIEIEADLDADIIEKIQ